jgi:casein kinase I family protein HRR25
VATSRINNYFESDGVVSEGGGLPIWDLGNGEKPEF